MTTVEHATSEASTAHSSGAAHAHPSDGFYWGIAGFLAVVTGIEVALSYTSGSFQAPLLLVGMAVKFICVAGFFMHLRFDSKVLRRLFISGLVLALFCYLLFLSMFRIFGPREDRSEINYVQSGIPVGPNQGGPVTTISARVGTP